MFSIGELIASGYCSLVSSGAPPPPGIDIAPLVNPGAGKRSLTNFMRIDEICLF